MASVPKDLSFLDQYDSAPLECDGMVRVLHKVLSDCQIPHALFVGSVQDRRLSNRQDLHFWIELPDGRLVDYRARMWLGNHAHIPHGVFSPQEYPDVAYSGRSFDELPIEDWLFQMLIIPNDQFQKRTE